MRAQHLGFILLLLCLCAFAQKKHTQTGSPVHVQVVGVDGEAAENIKELLSLNKNNELPSRYYNTTRARLSASTIPQSIKTALKPYGYFHARVRSHFSSQANGWLAHYDVTLGPRTFYGHITLKIIGPPLPPSAMHQLHKQWPIHSDKPFTVATYNEGKNLLSTIANTYGYFSSQMVSSQVIVHKAKNRADVKIVFSTGPRFHFGKTTIKSTVFAQSFLRRFLLYKQGEPYNGYQVQKTRNGLISSHYFSLVNVSPNPQPKEENVPINIELTPASSRSYLLGGGYGTDTGVRGLASANFNRLNKYGHQLHLLFRGSRINYTTSVHYNIPGPYPPTDFYSIYGEISKLDQMGGQAFLQKVGGSYSCRRGNWFLSAQLNALQERYNLDNWPKTSTTLLYPTLLSQTVVSDNALFPSHGYSVMIKASGANKGFISKTSFVQGTTSLRGIITLWDSERILMRTQIAYTEINSLEQLPLSLQLFAGGANSVRGYSYQSLRDGRALFTGSIELQQRITKSFYIAGFYDTGNVSNNIFHTKLKVGVGPAIVWVSPIGSIELSVAKPISEPNEKWRVHLSMGTFL